MTEARFQIRIDGTSVESHDDEYEANDAAREIKDAIGDQLVTIHDHERGTTTIIESR